MYDWPEYRQEIDSHWTELGTSLRASGIEAPARLTRGNADLRGNGTGAESEGSNADGFSFEALWLHPDLLLAQTCWGPLSHGLEPRVRVVAQPTYSGIEGGSGIGYSSAVVMRRNGATDPVAAPAHGETVIPWEHLEGRRFAYNSTGSLSGYLAFQEDCAAAGKPFPDLDLSTKTGGHRESIRAVAAGDADFAVIDCKCWRMAKEHEPAAGEVIAVGWTSRRMGLPIITSLERTDPEVEKICAALAKTGKYVLSAFG